MKQEGELRPRQTTCSREGDKKIDKYIFSLSRVIGKGSYATVYLGREISNEIPVAVKVIDKKIFANTYNVRSIQSEIDIMKKVNHPNVVKLLDVYQTNNNMYIVTELCEGGDLREYIRKRRKLCESQSLKILRDVLNAFIYLFKEDIIHRDLKPANILVHNGVYKISDFGFAKDLEFGGDTVLKSIVGTPLYMSPQILNKQEYTNKSDLWSIGLIFYEMIYGQTPWPANNQLQLLNAIVTRPIPFDAYISAQSKDFIRKCLKVKEEERMSWEQVFQHPLLQEMAIPKPSKQVIYLRHEKENRLESNHVKSTRKHDSKGKARTRKTLGTGRNTSGRSVTPKKSMTPKKCMNPRRTNPLVERCSPWRL